MIEHLPGADLLDLSSEITRWIAALEQVDAAVVAFSFCNESLECLALLLLAMLSCRERSCGTESKTVAVV
jgi:hypothetical protein